MNHARRNEIARMVNKNLTVKNSELMDQFNISIETVRRDLAYLEQQGVLERVYGGAKKKTFINSEPSFDNREILNHSEKEAIAKEAERFILPNATVYFDLGTTVQILAQLVPPEKQITAFTSALRTAIALVENQQTVILPGGNLRPKELAVSGSLAESNMKQFNIDLAFIGVAGITSDGISDFIMDEASLRRYVIQDATQVIVLADHTKFDMRAMCKICPLDDIDILITDALPPDDLMEALNVRKIQVIIANT